MLLSFLRAAGLDTDGIANVSVGDPELVNVLDYYEGEFLLQPQEKVHFDAVVVTFTTAEGVTGTLTLSFPEATEEPVDPEQPEELQVRTIVAGDNATLTGRLPEGATAAAVLMRGGTAPEGMTTVAVYNISIVNGEEELHHFDDPLTVTLTNSRFAEYKNLCVFHSGVDGLEEVGPVSHNGDTISFPASDFSVYIVVETGDDARLTVNFYNENASEPYNYILVKKSDLNTAQDDFQDGVWYDPGTGALPAGESFRGWTYDGDNSHAILDLNGVKTVVVDWLKNNTVYDATLGKTPSVISFHTVSAKAFMLTYKDQQGTVISVEWWTRFSMKRPVYMNPPPIFRGYTFLSIARRASAVGLSLGQGIASAIRKAITTCLPMRRDM